jgi:CRISPR-associated protein Cmx8
MPAKSIELSYILHDLPSAQHKAGLAGLLVVLRSLQARQKYPLPEVLHVSPGELRVRVSADSIRVIFDDLYDASREEVSVTRKWQGQLALREIPVTQRDPTTGRTKQVTQYIYKRVVPRAEFLRALGMPPVWIRLWRDALWSTLRGIPQTRLPYKERDAGKPAAVAADSWADLVRSQSNARKVRTRSTGLASALFIGAQARTAEGVAFQGDPCENLLLHFWPTVMTCWVPEVLRVARIGRRLRIDRQPVGYVLAVPEVADLEEFLETFPRVVGELSAEAAGYRPRQALISVPEEGALEFLSQVSRIVRARAAREETSRSVHAVEVYHLKKRGNTGPVLHAGRVAMDRGTLERYELVRGLRHPLLKGQLIRNLLGNTPWHHGFDGLFAVHPWEVFFEGEFIREVSRRFAQARSVAVEEVVAG